MRMRKIPIIIALSTLSLWTYAQTQKVTFNGAARSSIESNLLPETDTSNIDQSTGGNTVVDLRMDIKPSDNIRIKTDFRFANPMGGFWGQGAAIQLRHLSIKGVAGNIFKYRFGDIDLKMTPYTLYNTDGELSKNEAEIFKYTRNLNQEENFMYGNFWHQQGVDGAFRLGFDKLIQSADVSGFMVRNRSVEGSVIPDRLQGGTVVKCNINPTAYIGFNYISLFDLPKTVNNEAKEKYQNSVYSGIARMHIRNFALFAEAGASLVAYTDTSAIAIKDITGDFFEVGFERKFIANQLTFQTTYRRVSDDFYSAGAQSKRINYGSTPQVLPIVSENMYTRSVGLMDLVKDQTIYNQTITPQLMGYDYALNHVTPYGKATPNRKGVSVELDYTDSAKVYATSVAADFLQDVRGEGTEELRNYLLLNWNGMLAIHKLLDVENTIQITAGVQYASSTRDGKGLVPNVHFQSIAYDAGIEIELIPRFDVLAGAKIVNAEGTEYLTTRTEFNEIDDYSVFSLETKQTLYAGGVRYRFNDNIALTLQGSTYSFADATTSTNDFSIQQVYLLFAMKF